MLKERHLNILIADDDVDDQFLATQAIEELQHDCSVTGVDNGLELLDYLLKQGNFKDKDYPLPDLILLDINMPVLNGFGALSRIKDHESLCNIPVYILSTSHSKTDMLLSKQLKADGFYTKPIKFEELKGILEEIVSTTEMSY